MKHLGISGGGTKIAGLFGVAESIIFDQGYQPDIISGISAGAILALPLAMIHEDGIRQQVKETILNLEPRDFFSVNPFNRKGKIDLWNAIFKLIGGKHYLGRQDKLEKTISKVITRPLFAKYSNDRADKVYPRCIVGTVDFHTGKRFYIDLKTVTYEDFLKFVNASGALPIFTAGVKFNRIIADFEGKVSGFKEALLFDGGVRDHSPTNKILGSDKYEGQIKETSTIFSRPALADIRGVLDPYKFKHKSILEVLERYVDITNIEVSKNDELEEQKLIEAQNIFDHGTFYLPRILDGVYQTDKKKLKELYDISKGLVNEETWKTIPQA